MDGVCAHTAINSRCNDNRFCNGVEICSLVNGCGPGTAPSCNDDNANTTDRCDDATNACRNDPVDNDGDGDPPVSAGGHDCDDNDPTVSSFAREVCNMRDDNCNGMIDEGALNACGSCDPSCRQQVTGGMGGMPFNDPGRRGVEFDPMAGGLLVRAQSRMGDYLWIVNTNESTLSKWDAVLGTEIARYRVGLAAGECRGQCCHVGGCNMPSRTVVDGFGDAYIANRAFSMQGTVTKIAADRRDCVDRNGNGMIDTSAGAADVRPFGQDECVLWTSNVGYGNAVLRSIAIDRGDAAAPQGYPWVGTCGGAPFQIYKLDPRTGAVTNTLNAPGCLYGAVGTADGTVWFHQPGAAIHPVNSMTNTLGAAVAIAPPGGCASTYGITADARGRIWLSTPGCTAVPGYDPATRRWSRAVLGAVSGLGITTDATGALWTVNYASPSRSMWTWPGDAFVGGGDVPAAMIRTITFPAPIPMNPSAVGADRGGNIWFTTFDGPPTALYRYEPMMNRQTMFTGPNRVYTYTDFTGSVRRTVIGTGTYSEDYDTGCANPSIASLTFDGVTPMGTSLRFSLQTAPNAAGLGAARSVQVALTPPDASPVDVAARLSAAMPPLVAQRFARLTVTFSTSSMPIASPVLRSMSLAWRCAYNVPGM
jgi:streptogramin lyase